MTCQTAAELILENMDCLLTGERKAELESHLLQCQACRSFHRAQVTLDLALSNSQIAPQLSPAFGVRLNQKLRAEKRRVLWQWLPDLLHIGGGILATAACVVWFPFAAWLTLGVGALFTLGSYTLQTVLRFWLEDLEGL